MLKRLIKARNKPKFPVYREIGGYRAWKDKKPPRQDSLGRLIALIAVIGGLLAIPLCGIGWYSQQKVNERVIRQTQAALLMINPAATDETTPELTNEATAEATPETTLEPGESLILATATLTPFPIRTVTTEPTSGATPTLTPFPIRGVQTATRAPTLLQTLYALQTGTPTARVFPTLPLAQPSTARPIEVVITPQNEGGGSGGYPVEVVITAPPVVVVETVIVVQPPLIQTVIVYPTATETEITPELTDEPTATATPTETHTATASPTATATATATPSPTATLTLES